MINDDVDDDRDAAAQDAINHSEVNNADDNPKGFPSVFIFQKNPLFAGQLVLFHIITMDIIVTSYPC